MFCVLFNNINCCLVKFSVVIYIYIYINISYLRFKFLLKCNLHIISMEGEGPAQTLGEPLRASALLMSVQLQSCTPSVDPDVDNYLCNAVHLE